MFCIPQLAPKLSAPTAVVVEDHHTHRFPSRQEALAYALQECREAARRGASDAVIKIQGTDGAWRTFDSRLLPIHEADEPAGWPSDLADSQKPPISGQQASGSSHQQ